MNKLWVCALVPFLLPAEEKVDLYVVNRIKAEALQNSKVAENAFYLTDVYGPRLTNSPGYKAAGDWVVKRLAEWGISNGRLEKWGPFGRGWSNTRFAASLKEPVYTPLIAVPRPWSPGTNGPVAGTPLLAVIHTEADFEKFKGKLKGRIVLLEQPRPQAPITEAITQRFTDTELTAQQMAPEPGRMPFGRVGARPGQPQSPAAMREFRRKLNKFLVDEGVALTVVPSFRTDGGTIFASAAGSQDPKEPVPPPGVAMTSEHYNRICRLLEKKQPVTLEFDIENKFYDDNLDTFNVIAEIPGTTKKEQVIMIGGHLDSWTFGTGATDNAAGSAVVMEVMRILKDVGPEDAAHHPAGPVGGRRRRPTRVEGLRQGTLRRSHNDGAQAGALQDLGIFQPR